MKMIGFLQDEIAGVYGLIAGILHLGNVKFSDTFKNGMDTVNIVDQRGIFIVLLTTLCFVFIIKRKIQEETNQSNTIVFLFFHLM